MWLNTRLPPCHRPSCVWYCGESATHQAGSQVAWTAFVPTIQPTAGSFTTHAGSTVAVHGGIALAAGAPAPAASTAATSAIRPIRCDQTDPAHSRPPFHVVRRAGHGRLMR